jgi:hypothetical protein
MRTVEAFVGGRILVASLAVLLTAAALAAACSEEDDLFCQNSSNTLPSEDNLFK